MPHHHKGLEGLFGKDVDRIINLLDFPASREEIINIAQLHDVHNGALRALRRLPDRDYQNVDELIEYINAGIESRQSAQSEPQVSPGVEVRRIHTRQAEPLGPTTTSYLSDVTLPRPVEDINLPPGLEDRAGIEAQHRAGDAIEHDPRLRGALGPEPSALGQKRPTNQGDMYEHLAHHGGGLADRDIDEEGETRVDERQGRTGGGLADRDIEDEVEIHVEPEAHQKGEQPEG